MSDLFVLVNDVGLPLLVLIVLATVVGLILARRSPMPDGVMTRLRRIRKAYLIICFPFAIVGIALLILIEDYVPVILAALAAGGSYGIRAQFGEGRPRRIMNVVFWTLLVITVTALTCVGLLGILLFFVFSDVQPGTFG